MAWLETHEDLVNHRKVFLLAGRMRWSKHETIGRLECFWLWCLRHTPNGDLSYLNDEQIAQAAEVERRHAKKFVAAMLEAPWIDERLISRQSADSQPTRLLLIHNWLAYAGRYLRDTLYKHKKERWFEAQNLHRLCLPPTVSRQSADITADTQPTVSRVSAVTVPDSTVPDYKKRGVEVPAPEVNCPPRVEEVLAHALKVSDPISREICPPDVARDFFDYWQGRGWMLNATIQMSDFRPRLEMRWRELAKKRREESKKSGAKNGGVAAEISKKTRLTALEQLVQEHVANQESAHFREDCTPDQRRELTSFRNEIAGLRRELAKKGVAS